MFRMNFGLLAGMAAGVALLGAVGALMGNTRAARRRRRVRKMLKTAKKVCCTVGKITG